jgi:superfamily II DNA helicase RecQ
VIFPDRTIAEIVARKPASASELAAIHGLGTARLARFGRELYVAVKEALALSGEQPVAPPRAQRPIDAVRSDGPATGLYEALASWRWARAQAEDVPPFHVFANRVLDAIARTRPGTHEELATVPGVGPVKLERYGDEVLEVVATAA